MRFSHRLFLWLLLIGLTAAKAEAALPAGFSKTVVASVGSPTAFAFTPDGRLLITTQTGQIRIHDGTQLLSTPALTLTKICTNSERGLLGIAVDPDFPAQSYIYVYYTFKKGITNCTSPVNRVSRFTLPPSNVVDPASELVLIDNIQSTNGNHNAGDVNFGKDGYLYVSVGDAGCQITDTSKCQNQNGNARRRDILLGKILRIAKDGSIPATNPWLNSPGSRRCGDPAGVPSGNGDCRETFAWGLRNPFRFAFDPNALSTRFYINDVGGDVWEEIDEASNGTDFGWNVREGHCVTGSNSNCPAPPAGMVNPVYDYGHPTGCTAITGGAFIPNGIWPAQYDGGYLYGDYTCGRIFHLNQSLLSADFETAIGSSSVTHLRFGPFGTSQSLYYASYRNGGQIERIDYTGSANRSPVASAFAQPASGPAPLNVQFDASASSDLDNDPLTFDWNFGDGNQLSGLTNPIVSHTYQQVGTYFATLTVHDDAGGASNPPKTLRIDAGNSPPVPAISFPTTSTLFFVGQNLTLQGSASDPQDGALANSSLVWEILLHHIDEQFPGNAHTHPFLSPTSGNNIPVTAPAPEDLRATALSYLEIKLTATDSAGLSSTISQAFNPNRVNVNLQTTPSGLQLMVNGNAYASPRTLKSWQSYVLNLMAPVQLDSGNQPWSFVSWSDSGSMQHSVVTPGTAVTYSASFENYNNASPNVLRNDEIVNLQNAGAMLASIFVKFPQNPSLDVFGNDKLGTPGEGDTSQNAGSTDDDDFYAFKVVPSWIDPDSTALTDATRPLIFYQLDKNVVITLTKTAGAIRLSW